MSVAKQSSEETPNMPSDVLEALLVFGLLIIGIGLFYFGWQGYRPSHRARRMPGRATFSKSANPALHDRGIFIDHGMVSDKSTGKIKAQFKPSKAYYDTVTRH